MELRRTLVALLAFASLAIAFLPEAKALQVGQVCGECRASVDLGINGTNDCGQAGTTTSLTSPTSGCLFVNKVTVTGCLLGNCVWTLVGPGKSKQLLLCLTEDLCRFRVRWEYIADCGARINLTQTCSGSIFPCTTVPVAVPASMIYANVLPGDSLPCPTGFNDNFLMTAGCGGGCDLTFSVGDGVTKAIITARVGCSVCIDPVTGGPVRGGGD